MLKLCALSGAGNASSAGVARDADMKLPGALASPAR